MIVDANCAHELSQKTPAGTLVLKWLLFGRGALIAGGKLLTELGNAGMKDTLAILRQSGRLKIISDDQVEHEIADLKQIGGLKSNDIHVIAVCRCMSCSVVFTHDQALHEDLKNKSLAKFRRSIFQSPEHERILKRCECSSHG